MGAPLQLICPCHPLVPFFLDYVGVDPRVYPDFGVGPYLDALWGIGTLSFRASGANTLIPTAMPWAHMFCPVKRGK